MEPISQEDGQQEIEQLRARFDTSILEIEGVESISIGLNKRGKACLVVGTSIPIEEVRARLPKEVLEVAVEVVFIGKINAQ